MTDVPDVLLAAVAAGRSLWFELTAAEWPSVGGGWRLPPDAHATIAYLGKGLSSVDLKECVAAVASFAACTSAIEARVSGVARFYSAGEDGDPIVLLLDNPLIRGLRDGLLRRLEQARVPIGNAHDFDFTPHVTITRVPRRAHSAIPSPDRAAIRFTRLGVRAGDVGFDRELYR